MHIAPTTHEHGPSGKVYTYEGDFEVRDEAITWSAVVQHADEQPETLRGSIALSSPAIASVGEQAVRDDIVNRIDTMGNRRQE